MIKVDISNVWGQVTLSDLLAMEKEVAAAHTTLADGTGAGNDFLGWQNLPVREATEEITRIQRAAEKIRSDSDVFVVIGIGGSYPVPPSSCCRAPTTISVRARATPRSSSQATA